MGRPVAADNRLVTIPISHYCDKARWGLERCAVPYVEDAHLQGFHAAASRRAGGRRTLPVLVTPDRVFTQSTDILRFADEQAGDHRLFPTDDAETPRWVETADALGVHTRLLVYEWIFGATDGGRALAWRFGRTGAPWWQGAVLPVGFGLLRRAVRSLLGWTPEAVIRARAEVQIEFDRVAEHLSDGRPWLTGDRFTAADLTFAAMAAAVVLPPEYGVPLPGPTDLDPGYARELEGWRSHPAGAFALRAYREERRRDPRDVSPSAG